MGAFGSSLELADFLTAAVRQGSTGSTSLLVRGEGDLLAYPGLARGHAPTADAVAGFERDYALKALMRKVEATGRPTGFLTSPDGRHLVAFGRIEGPDWYLLITYPVAALQAAALRQAVPRAGGAERRDRRPGARAVGRARRLAARPVLARGACV